MIVRSPPLPEAKPSLAQRVRASANGSVLAVVTLVTLLITGLAIMLSHEPGFYAEQTGAASTPERLELSKQFLSRGTRLISDIHNAPVWMADFEEDKINAWLAEDFQVNHADQSLPAGVADPRVALRDDVLWLGFRYHNWLMSTVIQVGLKAWVPKKNMMAIELQGAWAGALPVPTSHTRHVFEQFASANAMNITWKRNGRNLVALLEFPRSQRDVVLQKVEISQGALKIKGGSSRLPIAADFAPSAN